MLGVCLAAFAPGLAGSHGLAGSDADVRFLTTVAQPVLRHESDERALTAGVGLLRLDLHFYEVAFRHCQFYFGVRGDKPSHISE